jgi:bifunctional UDP-N-acetylglucosamine pyrophosphorylase/glucosamine-1-phosphate N-acetyltransferase
VDAIILAAGLGTRLRPYTENTPKPLLPVQGRPILDWTLAALPKCVNRVVVVVHYLAKQVEEFLKSQPHFQDWTVVHQDNPRGTGDAVRSCREHVRSDRFLAMNGDDLYAAADLDALVQVPAGMLVHPVDNPTSFGIAFPKQDGTLERLVEKPNISGRHLANTGAYMFPRDVFEIELKLSPRNEYEVTQYVSDLALMQPVHLVHASFWLPIGTVEVWRKAETMDLAAFRRA